jgi:hypothetical protein
VLTTHPLLAPSRPVIGRTLFLYFYPSYRRLDGPQSWSRQVRKISPHRDSIPGPSSPYPVDIPTQLPGPRNIFSKTLVRNRPTALSPSLLAASTLHMPRPIARHCTSCNTDPLARGSRVKKIETRLTRVAISCFLPVRLLRNTELPLTKPFFFLSHLQMSKNYLHCNNQYLFCFTITDTFLIAYRHLVT